MANNINFGTFINPSKSYSHFYANTSLTSEELWEKTKLLTFQECPAVFDGNVPCYVAYYDSVNQKALVIVKVGDSVTEGTVTIAWGSLDSTDLSDVQFLCNTIDGGWLINNEKIDIILENGQKVLEYEEDGETKYLDCGGLNPLINDILSSTSYFSIKEELQLGIVKEITYVPREDDVLQTLINRVGCDSLFENCLDIDLRYASVLDTSHIKSFFKTFNGCRLLQYPPTFDTSSATSFSYMHYGNSVLEEVPEYNTSNGLMFENTLSNCKKLKTYPNWDLTKATSTYSMYSNCEEMEVETLNLDLPVCTKSNYMFSGCKKIKNVVANLPKLKNGGSMFSNCTGLETANITLGQGITLGQMCDHLFENCTALKSVVMNDVREPHLSYTFKGCSSLTNIEINQADHAIDDMYHTFYGCSSLVNLPENLNVNCNTWTYTFYGCSSLETIPAWHISGNASGITMSHTFDGCTNLKSILLTGFVVSFDISASTRFEQSDLVVILNNLSNVSTQQTLTMGETNLAKLTDDQKAIATAKNWLLA